MLDKEIQLKNSRKYNGLLQTNIQPLPQADRVTITRTPRPDSVYPCHCHPTVSVPLLFLEARTMSDFLYFIHYFRWFYVLCWAFPVWMYYDGNAILAVITGIISTVAVTLIYAYIKITNKN